MEEEEVVLPVPPPADSIAAAEAGESPRAEAWGGSGGRPAAKPPESPAVRRSSRLSVSHEPTEGGEAPARIVQVLVRSELVV